MSGQAVGWWDPVAKVGVSKGRWSKRPSIETLERWQERGGCKALDGCWVEPDGKCEHGSQSWLLALGYI